MKRALFLSLLLTVAASPFAAAQGVVAEEPNQKTVTKALIKEVPGNYPQTVSCFDNEDGTATFVLSDASMQTLEVELKGYHVNDMVVTRDSVFFCGSTSDRSLAGMVGYFEIASFFAGTSNATLWDDYQVGSKPYPVEELTRMVAFLNSYGERHLVCIGHTSDPYACVVDVTVSSIPGYVGGHLSVVTETLEDICVVGNRYGSEYYIVSSGFDVSAGRYISLRIYDCDNVLTSGTQNSRYLFCIDTAYRPWLDLGVLVSPVDNNGVFSTASFRKSPSGEMMKNSADLHLAFYKLADFLSGSLFGMRKSVELPMTTSLTSLGLDQYEVGMAKDRLALLYTRSGSTSEFAEVGFSSFSSPVSFSAFKSAALLQGLGLYNGNSQYVMDGYSPSTTTSRMFQTMTFGGSTECAETLVYELTEVDNVSAEKQTIAFDSQAFQGGEKNAEETRKQASVVKTCE